MALHMSLDHDGRVYFTITCDTCQQPLLNFDDACYSYPALRVEAVFAGWEAGDRPPRTAPPMPLLPAPRRQPAGS